MNIVTRSTPLAMTIMPSVAVITRTTYSVARTPSMVSQWRDVSSVIIAATMAMTLMKTAKPSTAKTPLAIVTSRPAWGTRAASVAPSTTKPAQTIADWRSRGTNSPPISRMSRPTVSVSSGASHAMSAMVGTTCMSVHSRGRVRRGRHGGRGMRIRNRVDGRGGPSMSRVWTRS
jgi:hypothetical protein